MIDFHTHILYGLDDGAQNLSESVELITSLKNQGVDTILLTPHFYFSNISEDGFIVYRKRVLEKINDAVKQLNVRLIPACEVYLSKINPVDNLNKFVIEGTQYILIELPFRSAYGKNVFDKISDIMCYNAVMPIIAHAERYPAIQVNPKIISQLIDSGCLIQMNTDSLFNRKTRGLALKMLEHEQVHCIGTDCHNKKRPAVYEKAKAEIEKLFGCDCFNRLQQNMEDILLNKTIKVNPGSPIKKRFGLNITF